MLTRCLLGYVFVLLLCTTSGTTTTATQAGFRQCITDRLGVGIAQNTDPSTFIHTSSSSSYQHLLQSSQQNPRWVNSTEAKPLFIVAPTRESQLPAIVLCSKAYDLQVRVRSGGHDYEGLSYTCTTPFVLVDLVNLRLVEIDMTEESAWVQSGATLGELYYAIAKKSPIHGFPAGICPSVGVGGHFSGGGFGAMHRKHGLAADNIVDARLVDVTGKIHERKSMGEDLFWAIRGSGGASFGIILAWKIKLVRVPPTVTVFTIKNSFNRRAAELVDRWQYIADKWPEELFVRVIIQIAGDGKPQANFNSLFLGKAEDLIPIMNRSFPELRLMLGDCTEMRWIESVMYLTGYQKSDPLEVLLDRKTQYKSNFKAKSDYVKEPIPIAAIEGIQERISQENLAFVIMDPYGGQMSDIPESAIPFPHRKGNLYNIQYLVKWDHKDPMEANKHMQWIRLLHGFMKPYVSKNPRASYVNYRDIDLGGSIGSIDGKGISSYLQASVWGRKYYKNNWNRLSMVKRAVDPDNFFRNRQSIPPYAL